MKVAPHIYKLKSGYKVDKQLDGVKHREAYPEFEEAVTALATLKLTGSLPMPSTGISTRQSKQAKPSANPIDSVFTVRDMYNLALKRGKPKPWTTMCKPAMVYSWLADNYLGWDREVSTIDMHYASSMIDWLVEQGNANATVNRKIAALRKAMNVAYRMEKIDKVPYFETRTETTGRIRIISYEEEAKILTFLESMGWSDWADFLKLFIETGCRPGELGKLECRDIDLHNGIIQLWENKTDHPRSVPLTDEAREIVMRHMSIPSAKLFPFYNIHTLDKQIWHPIREHMDDYTKDFVPYACRHTCASRLVAAGTDIQVVKEWMGHTSIVTTQRYVKLFSPGQLAHGAENLRLLRESNVSRQVYTSLDSGKSTQGGQNKAEGFH
jgi:integrase